MDQMCSASAGSLEHVSLVFFWFFSAFFSCFFTILEPFGSPTHFFFLFGSSVGTLQYWAGHQICTLYTLFFPLFLQSTRFNIWTLLEIVVMSQFLEQITKNVFWHLTKPVNCVILSLMLLGAIVQNSLWNPSVSLHSMCAALFSHEWMSSVSAVPVPHWVLTRSNALLLFFQNRVYLCVCMCMCVCACTPFLYALFLQMYKTSFWGVLTCFVDLVLELLPFLHSHLHFPAQAFSVLVCYAVSSHKPAATYLHSIRGLQIFVTLGFYNILALFMWLTSAFVQSICHVKLFALLRFMQCTMMVLCVAVSILLWQEKMGWLTRFSRPYFAHSHLHGLLCIPCFLDDGSLGIDSAPGWP